MSNEFDLFGDPIIKDVILRDIFIEPPFSILDTKTGSWQRRKKQWKSIGIKSEVGREKGMTFDMPIDKYRGWDEAKLDNQASEFNTSVFDPALCEVLYRWFVPEGGTILDPFAGGSVRGIVSNYLGYKYTGIDIRPEQIESNIQQGKEICKNNVPNWLCGDSNIVLDDLVEKNELYDFVFSCPPYADLEVYSELEGDISNMEYPKFLDFYQSIITKSCKVLKKGGLACFVVGEVRDKGGYYYGFVPDTIKAFEKAGLRFYNEAILLNAIASASMRATNNMKSKKLVKVHQNVLIFKKPD
jgi:DNA modification methylase